MSSDNRPPFGPFAIALPARDFYAGGFVCVAIPQSAVGLIQSAIEGLKYVESWEGPSDERNLSAVQWEDIIALLMHPVECESISEIVETVYKTGLLIGDEEMGQVVTDITCIDGVLYKHFGPCCKEAIICDVGSIIQPPPEDTNPDPEDPTTWACNKSQGIAITWFGVINEVVAALEGISNLYEMYDPCKNVLSRFGAQWDNVRQVCLHYFNYRTAVEEMAADTDTPKWLACSWASTLLPTDNLSSAEFWTIQTSFSSRWASGAEPFYGGNDVCGWLLEFCVVGAVVLRYFGRMCVSW